MKYILVIDHIATGGAERILIDYFHFLLDEGHIPYIFVLSGHKGQSEWTEGINVIYGAEGDEDNLLKKTVQQLNLFFKLKKYVDKIKPDVVFSFLEKSNLLTIVTPSKATKVVSVHNVLSIQYKKVKSTFVRKILYGMIRWAYNKCPNVIAVSKQVEDDLIGSFKIIPAHIHVINNYVDRDGIQLKAQEQIDNFEFNPNIKYIMNVGRFSDQKAQWKLLKAFSLYLTATNVVNDVELVLMGNGDYTEALKKLAVDLKIENKTRFLPFNVNPYKYMAHAHLFVLSSIYEGFPIVLAEVSSLRIPFVGTRQAIPEEMFTMKSMWEQCVFDSTTFEKDFSTVVHEDERALALLLQKGINDKEFREMILQHTMHWEQNNDKNYQFKIYDEFK